MQDIMIVHNNLIFLASLKNGFRKKLLVAERPRIFKPLTPHLRQLASSDTPGAPLGVVNHGVFSIRFPKVPKLNFSKTMPYQPQKNPVSSVSFTRKYPWLLVALRFNSFTDQLGWVFWYLVRVVFCAMLELGSESAEYSSMIAFMFSLVPTLSDEEENEKRLCQLRDYILPPNNVKNDRCFHDHQLETLFTYFERLLLFKHTRYQSMNA